MTIAWKFSKSDAWMNTLERKTHCFVPPKKNKSEWSMIGITSRNYASIYIFCQLDQSIRDYFYKILLGGAWSKKKNKCFSLAALWQILKIWLLILRISKVASGERLLFSLFRFVYVCLFVFVAFFVLSRYIYLPNEFHTSQKMLTSI